MQVPVAVALALCLLAGCVAKPPAGTQSATDAGSAGPAASGGNANATPKVTTIKVSLAAGEPGLGPGTPVSEPTDTEKGAFEVPTGATSTLVEAKWTCSTPACSFSLSIQQKDGKAIASAPKAEGSARILTTTLAPGSYLAALRSGGPAANMAGEIRVSTLAGNFTDGYSAFAGK